ncbi:hypothetical protein RFI_25514, partial [Reticulomyxa filosa]
NISIKKKKGIKNVGNIFFVIRLFFLKKKKKKVCEFAYEMARIFKRSVNQLAMEVREKSRQIDGYKGFFGKDIFEHMKKIGMDCCLVASGNNNDILMGRHKDSKKCKCTHKDYSCVITHCELLLRCGYLCCTGQKNSWQKIPFE